LPGEQCNRRVSCLVGISLQAWLHGNENSRQGPATLSLL
jgi:hypothetical protein